MIITRDDVHAQVITVKHVVGQGVAWYDPQAAAWLIRGFPALGPQRAHRSRCAVLRLQWREQMLHQVLREQHALDGPLWHRLLSGDDGVGGVACGGTAGAKLCRELHQRVVRQRGES